MKNQLDNFTQKLCDNAYEFLGSFLCKDKTIFRVWAPNARGVSVVGDFNNWDITASPMQKVANGIWETEIEGLKEFDKAGEFEVCHRVLSFLL